MPLFVIVFRIALLWFSWCTKSRGWIGSRLVKTQAFDAFAFEKCDPREG
jgi:hypothetical protein